MNSRDVRERHREVVERRDANFEDGRRAFLCEDGHLFHQAADGPQESGERKPVAQAQVIHEEDWVHAALSSWARCSSNAAR